MSSRLYERAQQARHFMRQRWATWIARRNQTNQINPSSRTGIQEDLHQHQLLPLEPRLLLSASISGQLFADADSDGLFGSAESGIAGWRVYLDQNQNGLFDTGEASVFAGTGGAYTLDGLSAGTYDVRSIPTAGWTGTVPSGNVHQVTLATDEVVDDKDFGFRYGMAVDDGSTYFSDTGGWATSHDNYAFESDYRSVNKGDGSSVATWEFEGLTAGYYQVYATWQNDWGWATADAPYTVYDDTTALGTSRLNQKIVADDATFSGRGWELVGTYEISSDRIVVTLNNNGHSGIFMGTHPNPRGRSKPRS